MYQSILVGDKVVYQIWTLIKVDMYIECDLIDISYKGGRGVNGMGLQYIYIIWPRDLEIVLGLRGVTRSTNGVHMESTNGRECLGCVETGSGGGGSDPTWANQPH